MGHCPESDLLKINTVFPLLWATVANLVLRCGPLRRIWKGAVGHSAGLLVIRKTPERRTTNLLRKTNKTLRGEQ
jgi:hypothetical protein